MQDATDEELMAAYKRGDARAFGTLFDRWAPRLHAFFGRSFRNRAVCDDLLQLTFLKVHHGRASFTAGSPVRPWLYAIASRVRVDELRRRYRTPEQTGEDALAVIAADDASSVPDAARSEIQSRVRRAIAELPESQRLVVLLHRFEGLTFAEIAEVLEGIEGSRPSEVAVRVRAFRAHALLREKLLDLADDPASVAGKEGTR